MRWAVDPNSELNRYWGEWAESHSDLRETMVRAVELAKTIEWKERFTMDEKDFSQMRNRLLEFNSKWESQKKLRSFSEDKKSRYFRWWSVAASVLIAGFLLYNLADFQSDDQSLADLPQEWIVKSTPKGVKKVFHLPDGSTVTLNSASEIRYLSTFSSNRTIELTGQAFFDVEKNELLPFTVISGELNTTVLGTSFDISAYPDEDRMHVAVVTGKVKVDTEDGISATLMPTEATFYDTEENSLEKGSYDYNHLLGWRHRILKFQNESYLQVFNRLSKWYNVRFDFAPGLELKGQYSAEFQDESLENVLRGMQYSLGITFEIEGGVVKITRKK